MGDKTVKDRDWSNAVGQAARPLSEEAKKAQEAEFKKRPWKDPKKEWDQALREYVEKKK